MFIAQGKVSTKIGILVYQGDHLMRMPVPAESAVWHRRP